MCKYSEQRYSRLLYTVRSVHCRLSGRQESILLFNLKRNYTLHITHCKLFPYRQQQRDDRGAGGYENAAYGESGAERAADVSPALVFR